MTYKIYRVFNQSTQRCYVGCTKNVRKRMNEHKIERPHIFEGENYRVDILEECSSIEIAYARERFWIKENKAFETGYNRQTGGRWGWQVHAEVKAIMRLHGLKRKVSPETRAKLSQASKGRACSPETRAKISAARTGGPGADPRKRVDWEAHHKKMNAANKAKGSWAKGKTLAHCSEIMTRVWQERRASGQASAVAARGWATRRRKQQEKT